MKSTLLTVLPELYAFFKERKKLWLFPLVFLMFLLGLLIVASQGSVAAPFVYTLF